MLAWSMPAPWSATPIALAQGIDFRVSESANDMLDDVLVESVTHGDHDAFAALYDRHSALVYGIARRMLGDGPQPEDVAQSVFLQVWTRPEAYRGGNFAAWIARVTRNACLDILRSSAVRLREPELPADVAVDAQIDEQVFTQMRAEAVTAALGVLSADQRSAIEKAYFEGLSYREVAETLGEPLGTVKSRIRIGLRRLWEALREEVPS
jgi:RNA polymerase sigma-70 factor (ECF subfamily)